MNIIDVALKDLKRVFRSIFALVMMFGAPLLISGLLYFAFGGLANNDGSFSLPQTRLVIANQDTVSSNSEFKAGEMLVNFLQNEELTDVLEISIAPTESNARSAVDTQKADVALIIPANFTQAALSPEQNAEIVLYQDPTLTIGPGIVKDLINHFMDGFSGAKIAVKVANAAVTANGDQPEPGLSEQASKQYASYLQSSDHAAALRFIAPSGNPVPETSRLAMMGPIMASMMIFFVFFMGANGAESIIREHEEGTLARLFTTPTSSSVILAGKFLGVFVTLIVQTIVLLVVSSLLFHISWGKPLAVGMAALGLVVAATGFGVMLMSFLKSTRQTGPVLGGVLTLTGMIGGLIIQRHP